MPKWTVWTSVEVDAETEDEATEIGADLLREQLDSGFVVAEPYDGIPDTVDID